MTQKISRRNVAKGVAWSAPVVMSTTTIPAYAASMQESNNFVYPQVETGATGLGFTSSSVNYYTGEKLCSTDFCPIGETITSIRATARNTLIPVYGDYNRNIDSFGNHRVTIDEFTPQGVKLDSYNAGSEAIGDVTTFNGITYVTTLDPSDNPAFGQTQASMAGAMVTRNDTWFFMNNHTNHEHVYSVVQIGNTLYWLGMRAWNYELVSTELNGDNVQKVADMPDKTMEMYTDGSKIYVSQSNSTGATQNTTPQKYVVDLTNGSTTKIANTLLPTTASITNNNTLYWLATSGYIFSTTANKWLSKPTDSTGSPVSIVLTGGSLREFYALDKQRNIWRASVDNNFQWSIIGDIANMSDTQFSSLTAIGGLGSSVAFGTKDGYMIFI